jgi:hemerythrin superfamily protein
LYPYFRSPSYSGQRRKRAEYRSIHRRPVMSEAKSHASHTKAHQNEDAITLLTADHAKVKKLFKEFADLKEEDGSAEDKSALVTQICNELKVHAEIEEEIFYPAVRKAIDDADLMDEALVEHAGAKELIAQLEDMSPDDELYDAKVTVLGEQIQHHVKEEEGEMFPKARKAKIDGEALGVQMTERKAELMAETDEETPKAKPHAARKPAAGTKAPTSSR